MKYQKKFILVFALFWIIGLLGGYFLGVGSAILPNENIEYNYYFSEKASDSDVEPISQECSDNSDLESEGVILKALKSIDVLSIPKRIFNNLFAPSACNQHELEVDSKREIA